ncbi:CotY/CotZ family spore coat protein [Domibacillus sp. DTU_2020_1001157_1_SI_ALB_TIR_016]|uniref:CotY/CotZ family spore coat protein n=1 Tax=Domibacillus sp. DTU_2020_1001157_1_SI_ALB_TIR_016 TaxID=3077789 RepID=UPI0028E9AF2A|nr:CotY/CotZ family spore coat protein [Domibacillus sp. DTU_2020_1001157_1_SI_ALB_TIR_016]WNS80304.1 CotY/CotZ family spore coat protein [Domibacillus sp. DTU_2020_1001157_1_SI_ALB_TIR_016]
MSRRSGLGFFLQILKEQQDQLKGMKTDICSSLLAKIFEADTIPIMLKTDEDYFEAAGSKNDCPFTTRYFRIEHLDEEEKTVTLSLLQPLDVCCGTAVCFHELSFLERTNVCVTVCIEGISAIQCLDMELMVRRTFIEPKW